LWRAQDAGENGIYAEDGKTFEKLKSMVNGQFSMFNEK
jgi:hypothetical protein